MLSHRYIHTKTQMCAAHPPTHTPKLSNALNINTCPHLHTFTKIPKDVKFVRMNFHVQLLPCMHASNPCIALSHMHKFTHSLPPSHTYLKKKKGEILVVFVRVHLCGHSLSLSPSSSPMHPNECRIPCLYVCVWVWASWCGEGGLRCWITVVCLWQLCVRATECRAVWASSARRPCRDCRAQTGPCGL